MSKIFSLPDSATLLQSMQSADPTNSKFSEDNLYISYMLCQEVTKYRDDYGLAHQAY